MVRMYTSSYRSTSVPVGAYEPFEFSHMNKANVALDDLNSLTQASRRHDRNFIDDLNAKLIVDSSLGLPPRAVKKHHSYVTPAMASSHVSRRVFTDGVSYDDVGESLPRIYTPVTSSYARGYSLPPSTYNDLLFQNGVQLGRSNRGYGDARRMSLAADSAVRQAHRDVTRVERELGMSHYDEPSAFSRKHRSVSYHGPRRDYSIAPRPAVVYEHSPSTHYYQHREHQLPHYEIYESMPSHRPLYPPEKLVRCLTETPVTRISGRSVEDYSDLRSRTIFPSYTPQLHISTPAPVVTKRSYAKIHSVPHHTRSTSVSSSLNRLPDSVRQWYHKPTRHYYGSSFDLSSPVVTSYQYQPIRSHVTLTSSSTPSSAPSASLGPSPPYHTRVIGEESFESYSSSGSESHHHHAPYFSSWTPAPAPVYHQHIASRVHHAVPTTVYAAKMSSLSPSLDKPLESHIGVSEARKKVREVLCKVPERIGIY